MFLSYYIKKLPIFGYYTEYFYRFFAKRKTICFEIKAGGLELKNGWLLKIGSNDGSTNDPLLELLSFFPKLNCFFVEPVSHLLDKAKENWGDGKRFRYLNVAVGEDGEENFYVVDQEAVFLPELQVDISQIGSFDKQHIIKHDKRLVKFIKKITVKSLNINQVLSQVPLPGVEILHIDAEGWDWNILKSIKLDLFTPNWIVFEKSHLVKQDLEESLHFLGAKYEIKDFGDDFLCKKRL